MGLIALSYLGGSCFCLLAYILVMIMHPLAVFLLLQQELRSVVQFLNDLISSTFSIFSLEFFQSTVGLLPHYSLFLPEFYSTFC